MDSPQPPVTIIVLSYNGKRFLKDCFESIFSQGYPAFEVMFVDNGSSDGSAEYVAEHFPQVTLVALDRNIGFAAGNNRGVEQAKHDLIVLLNNDTIVEPGWLATLVDGIMEPGVGLASSRAVEDSENPLYYARNGTINFLERNVMLAFKELRDIFYCNGCSCIFRRSEFGLPFDDDYFLYSEDTYLGLRCRFAGRTVRHRDDSRLKHFGSSTVRREKSSFVSFFQERNRLLNNLLFFSVWTNIRFIPYYIVNFIGVVGYGLLRARKGLPGVLRAQFWFLFHPLVVLRKRKAVQAQRKVGDAEVIRYMSCKIVEGDSGFSHFVNGTSKLYCRLVGLKPMELVDPDWQTEFVRSFNAAQGQNATT